MEETCSLCGEELVQFSDGKWGCNCYGDSDEPACAAGCGGYPEACSGCNLGGNG